MVHFLENEMELCTLRESSQSIILLFSSAPLESRYFFLCDFNILRSFHDIRSVISFAHITDIALNNPCLCVLAALKGKIAFYPFPVYPLLYIPDENPNFPNQDIHITNAFFGSSRL